MRCQRMMMSISVWLSMWPMWRRPVTLGGGRSRLNVRGVRPSGGVGAWKEILVFPILGPTHFDGAGLVRFGKFVGHEVANRRYRFGRRTWGNP